MPVSVKESDDAYINRPNIDGCRFFVNGEIREWTGAVQIVESPIFLEGTKQKVDVLYLLAIVRCSVRSFNTSFSQGNHISFV